MQLPAKDELDLDDVDACSIGDDTLLFSEEQLALKTVLDMLEHEGATVVRKPTRIGRKWLAAVRADPLW